MTTATTPDPASWRGDDPGIEDRLRRRLCATECAVLHDLAGRPGDRGAEAISAKDLDHPLLGPLVVTLRRAILDGPGAIILSGPDPDLLPEGGLERIFRGVGACLGTASIQSPAGERIARVERRDDNIEARGTWSDLELRPHTDLHEVLALACVSEAAEGGDSMLVSAAALRDAVRRRAPEALAPLERGYPHGINEKAGGVRPVTEAPVPIFSTTGGRLACCYNRYFIHSAARLSGEDLPADLAEAMAILDEEAVLPGLGLRFRLRPGEMLFWHNWTCLHARTAFRDSASRRRLLLRLWLNLSDGRAVDPRVAARAAQIDADHRLALARRRAA